MITRRALNALAQAVGSSNAVWITDRPTDCITLLREVCVEMHGAQAPKFSVKLSLGPDGVSVLTPRSWLMYLLCSAGLVPRHIVVVVYDGCVFDRHVHAAMAIQREACAETPQRIFALAPCPVSGHPKHSADLRRDEPTRVPYTRGNIDRALFEEATEESK